MRKDPLDRSPVYVGIAFIVNTVWPIIFLPFGIALLYYGVISREGSYLRRVLGDEYLKYNARSAAGFR